MTPMMWEKLKKAVLPALNKLMSKLSKLVKLSALSKISEMDKPKTPSDKKDVGKEDQADKNKLRDILSLVISFFFVIFSSFVLAQTVAALAVPSLLKPVLAPKKNKKDDEIVLKSVKVPNYRDINKDVLKRNIFNDEGKFPEESENGSEETARSGFDLNAPCSDTKLPLTLVGTIYLDGGESVAIINEKGITDSDTYHTGDRLISFEDAEIVQIEAARVVINNKGRKECLENSMTKQVKKGADKKSQQAKLMSSTVTLTSDFVASELGDGSGKIVQSARLVPNTVDSKFNGYKIFSIKPGSLFDKIGLKEGDVITKVNNVEMTVERGFALHEAFQEASTVTINALADDVHPKTITVFIK